MTRTTPGLSPLPLHTSAPHQRDDVWPPTYDLACNRPDTRRHDGDDGFRTWDTSTPKTRHYHKATAASSIYTQFILMKAPKIHLTILFLNKLLRSFLPYIVKSLFSFYNTKETFAEVLFSLNQIDCQ
ncbi:hypothetical protein AVEN_99045-1 [Araneus ventricosus]|uniref:Uncharacterized protein n=1 Tax=Araneus ventricosus TaxID=182803 RepID=A0A4Y2R887_ARAVE|nr:hypothetical protein AVEN_99045-1 [Araneus ventricosus]